MMKIKKMSLYVKKYDRKCKSIKQSAEAEPDKAYNAGPSGKVILSAGKL